MFITDFDFELPDALIAQKPLKNRENSRILVLDRKNESFDDDNFFNFRQYLRENDTLVLNNTKVFPARLFGRTETGANVEIFLAREMEKNIWETLARPARRLKIGGKIGFDKCLTAKVLEKTADGRVIIGFEDAENFDEILDEIGKTPLPPYIKREKGGADTDRERYQTIFARERGAIAAPTAGLHFTPQILDEIKNLGVTVAEITLHVGYGTFEPVRVSDLKDHKVLPERCEIGAETAEILNRAKAENRRIIAVGTTTTRALETNLSKNKKFTPEKFEADLTITPGFRFRAIDGLLTNFHLPQSSLLVLVSTFAGHEFIMKAYNHAVREKYRFYSYGDCMLIL